MAGLKKYKLISPWDKHQGDIKVSPTYETFNLRTLDDNKAERLLELGFEGIVKVPELNAGELVLAIKEVETLEQLNEIASDQDSRVTVVNAYKKKKEELESSDS